MTHARSRLATLIYDEREPLIQYWIATLLAIGPIWRTQVIKGNNETFANTDILDYLDLNTEAVRSQPTPPAELDRYLEGADLTALFRQNRLYDALARLCQTLALNECERRLLTLTWHINSHSLLNQCMDGVSSIGRNSLFNLLAVMSGQGREPIARALNAGATLPACGLVTVSPNERFLNLADMVRMDYQMSALLEDICFGQSDRLDCLFRFAEPARLKRDDYAHCDDDLGIISVILRDALASKRTGVNILIHGEPGTGKTELAHLLANLLDVRLAVVPELDTDQNALPAYARLGRLNACQMALASHHACLILFDEAEDTLLYGQSGQPTPGKREISKAALTRVLETNARPVIWISNHIDMVDPALLRRFTHLMRLDSPTPQHRRRVLDNCLGDLPVSETWRQCASEIRDLSPAMYESAAHVGALCQQAGLDPESVMSRTLDARLDALDSRERVRAADQPMLPWRSACLNASEDVASLSHCLRHDSQARLCLYGPPGTGKTAWARQLAQTLKMPLTVCQAADLIHPMVGVTERLIARAFRNAEQDQAILLIDEADTFLRDRRQARAGWEVSQVNQFLTCLEQHGGLFIATTNRLDDLDEAAMRRFDFRIGFDYLGTDGAILLTRDLADRFGIPLPEEHALREALQPITTLAPGDFAALARRLTVRQPLRDFSALLDMIRQEVAYKGPLRRAIGFHNG